MNQYKFNDEITNNVIKLTSKKNRKTIDDVIKEINNINNVFKSSDVPTNTSETLQKLENIELNENKINEQAKNELIDYKQSSLNKIEKDYNTSKEKLSSSVKSLTSSAESDKLKLKNYYNDAKQNVSDEALARGLQRSSIVINQMDALSKEEIENYKNIDKELTQNINALNFEINGLAQERDKALSDFDILYAVKLNEKINTLTSDIRQQQTAIVKYNNEIAEKENSYAIKMAELEQKIKDGNWDKETDIVEMYAKYGSNMMDKVKQNQINNAVDNYFSGYTKEDAYNELISNQNLKDALGIYYDMVVNKYK